MQKATDQARNHPTYKELFGEDASEEDELEHGSEQSGTDGKRRKYVAFGSRKSKR